MRSARRYRPRQEGNAHGTANVVEVLGASDVEPNGELNVKDVPVTLTAPNVSDY